MIHELVKEKMIGRGLTG